MSTMGNRKTPLLSCKQDRTRRSHSGFLNRSSHGKHASHHLRQRRMVGKIRPSSPNRNSCKRQGRQAATSRYEHYQGITWSIDNQPYTSLHNASLTCAPSLNGPLSITGGRLHSPIRQSARMEMGRPSEAIDDMDQGVPLRSMPGRKITPPDQAGRSHHSQPTEATDRDGTTHPVRYSCAITDLYNTDPTGSPGGASKEERPSIKVGLTSPLPVQTRKRTRSRRPS